MSIKKNQLRSHFLISTTLTRGHDNAVPTLRTGRMKINANLICENLATSFASRLRNGFFVQSR